MTCNSLLSSSSMITQSPEFPSSKNCRLNPLFKLLLCQRTQIWCWVLAIWRVQSTSSNYVDTRGWGHYLSSPSTFCSFMHSHGRERLLTVARDLMTSRKMVVGCYKGGRRPGTFKSLPASGKTREHAIEFRDSAIRTAVTGALSSVWPTCCMLRLL